MSWRRSIQCSESGVDGAEVEYLEKEMSFKEKLFEKTIGCLIELAKDAMDKNRLKKQIKSFLEIKANEFKCYSREEEFDFEGLKSYILDGFGTEGTSYLIGTEKKRKTAYETILNKSLEYSKAETPKAKERVKTIVDEALDIIRVFYREKNDVGSLVLMAEMEDTVAANIQSIALPAETDLHLSVSANRFFVHRENELAKMSEILEKDGWLVLSGMGGIGKSGLAKHYASIHRGMYKSQLLISCKESIRTGLIKNAFVFGVSRLNDNETDAQLCERVLHEIMKAEPGSFLLIFDDASPDDELIDCISTLCQHKIMTSRRSKSEWSCQVIEVGALESVEAQKDLFEKYLDRNLKEDESEDFNSIAAMVAGHTLTLQLIALTALKSSRSLEELRSAIESVGLYTEDSNVFKYGDSREERNMYGHICVIWNMAGFSEEESGIMQALSLIAPNEIGIEEFGKWLGLENYNSINRLVEQGWVHTCSGAGESEIYLHSVIAEVVYRELYCKEPMNFDSMAEALQEKVDNRNLIYEEQLRYNSYGVSFGKRYLGVADSVYILNLAALQLEYFGRLDESLELLKIADGRLDKLSDSEHILAGHTYNNFAVIFQRNAKYDEAIDYYYKSIEVYKSANPPLYGNVGYSLHNIARTYYFSEDYDKAMEVENEAEELIKEHNIVKLGEVYDLKRELYYLLGDFVMANEYGEDALDAKLAYDSENRDQFWRSVLDLIKIKVRLDETYDPAEDFNGALEFYKNTTGEDSEQVANVYERMKLVDSLMRGM